MATIDKISVRDELERLKREFKQLCSDGKMSMKIRVVMDSLLVVVKLILSVFLEKKTRKNTQKFQLAFFSNRKRRDLKYEQGEQGERSAGLW